MAGATVGINAAAGEATSKLRTLYRQAIVVVGAAAQLAATKSSKLCPGGYRADECLVFRSSLHASGLPPRLHAREIGVGPSTRREQGRT